MLSSISLSTGNIFGLLAVVCILLFALSLGRTRTLISLLAIYVAFAIQAVFPYFSSLQKTVSLTDDLPTLRIGILLLAYVGSFVLLNRSILQNRFNQSETSFFQIILMCTAQLGFLISIILNLAPAFKDYIPQLVIPYIANQTALFYWALAPLLLLAFQKKD